RGRARSLCRSRACPMRRSGPMRRRAVAPVRPWRSRSAPTRPARRGSMSRRPNASSVISRSSFEPTTVKEQRIARAPCSRGRRAND
ncbi:hypothetical protein LTR94_037309, partial [Friedmanniomyces endolithicus]